MLAEVLLEVLVDTPVGMLLDFVPSSILLFVLPVVRTEPLGEVDEALLSLPEGIARGDAKTVRMTVRVIRVTSLLTVEVTIMISVVKDSTDLTPLLKANADVPAVLRDTLVRGLVEELLPAVLLDDAG